MKNSDKTILIIGKNKKNNELLAGFFAKNNILSIPATELTEAKDKLENGDNINLVLVDVSGYDKSVWGFLNELFEKRVPFLVIYPPQAAGKASPPPGSQGMLTKPLNPKVLLSLVKNLLFGE